MRTAIFAFAIALMGLLMIVVGAWSLFLLVAESAVQVPLYIITLGMISGGFAMGGLAQALRLLLLIVRRTERRL
jgi:hypothetical protein